MKRYIIGIALLSLIAAPLAMAEEMEAKGDADAELKTEVRGPRDQGSSQASGRAAAKACVGVAPACPSPKISQCHDGAWVCVGPATAQIQKVVADLRAQLDIRKGEFMEMSEQKREEAHDRMEQEREALHERVNEFKDKAKAQIVTRVHDAFNNVNARITASWENTLNKLSDLLGRLKAHVDELKANGAATAEAEAQITAADTAIADAQAAVTLQTGKTYTVEITSETAVKGDVSTVRATLRTDLEAVKTKVKAAREALRKAIQTVKTIDKATPLLAK